MGIDVKANLLRLIAAACFAYPCYMTFRGTLDSNWRTKVCYDGTFSTVLWAIFSPCIGLAIHRVVRTWLLIHLCAVVTVIILCAEFARSILWDSFFCFHYAMNFTVLVCSFICAASCLIASCIDVIEAGRDHEEHLLYVGQGGQDTEPSTSMSYDTFKSSLAAYTRERRRRYVTPPPSPPRDARFIVRQEFVVDADGNTTESTICAISTLTS